MSASPSPQPSEPSLARRLVELIRAARQSADVEVAPATTEARGLIAEAKPCGKLIAIDAEGGRLRAVDLHALSDASRIHILGGSLAAPATWRTAWVGDSPQALEADAEGSVAIHATVEQAEQRYVEARLHEADLWAVSQEGMGLILVAKLGVEGRRGSTRYLRARCPVPRDLYSARPDLADILHERMDQQLADQLRRHVDDTKTLAARILAGSDQRLRDRVMTWIADGWV